MRSDAECGVAEQGKCEGSPIEQGRGLRKFNLIEIINKRMVRELCVFTQGQAVESVHINQNTF